MSEAIRYAGIGGVGPESYGSAMGMKYPKQEVAYSPPITEVVNNIQKDLCAMEELLDVLTNKLMPVLNLTPTTQEDNIYPVASNSPLASDLIHINQRIAVITRRMYGLRDDIQL